MLPKQPNSLSYKKHSITIALGAIVMLCSLFSCGKKKEAVGEAILERDSMAFMSTYGIESFVTDSGITKYRIVTEEWLMFDKKNPPYWSFEKGVYLEQLDTLLKVRASVKADTAYYYERKKLWELIGNVQIMNLQGDRFETNLLYWDQQTEKVYTNQENLVRIIQPDKIVTGYGFESDQQFEDPVLWNVEAVIEVDKEE